MCAFLPCVKSVSLTTAVTVPTFIVSPTAGLVVCVAVRDVATTTFLMSSSCYTIVPHVVEPALSVNKSPTANAGVFPVSV